MSHHPFFSRSCVLTPVLFTNQIPFPAIRTAIFCGAIYWFARRTFYLYVAFLVPVIFFSTIALVGLITYTPEVYPTLVRASGAGAATFVGRLGNVVGPVMFALALDTGFRFAMLFLGICFLISGLVSLFLPYETAGKRLVDDVEDMDLLDASVPAPPSFGSPAFSSLAANRPHGSTGGLTGTGGILASPVNTDSSHVAR